MRRHAIAASIALMIATPAGAQIPVTDVAHVGITVANQIETMLKWVEQYNQMTKQIEELERQYEALTGARNLGQVLNNPLLRHHLPPEWRRLYARIQSTGVLSANATGQAVFNRNHVFDACAHHTDAQRFACEARSVKGALDAGLALDAYDSAESRIEQIDGLMQMIDRTEDPKAIAELQGRIAAEQANIENEQTKLQLYKMVAAAEDKIQEQRETEVSARTWAAEGGIQAEPMTFR